MDNIVPSHTSQDKPQTTFIYVLTDPETNEVRYVGKSNNPQKRLERHRNANEDTRRQRWVNNLKRRGLKPIMQVIEEVPVDSWSERERYWIAYYRTQGCDLTNTAEGGAGGNPSPETKAKIAATLSGRDNGSGFRAKMKEVMATKKGIKRPPEVGEKVSASMMGRKRTPFSEEWRRNIGLARKGRKRSRETRERISLSKKRSHVMRKLPPSGTPTLWD